MFDGAEGVLAIWNDIRDGRTEEFEVWFKGEHLYVADSPGVLAEPA